MKTPWFKAGKQNPVRVGVYEARHDMFKYWDGKRWGGFSETPKQAIVKAGYLWANQTEFYWRGLLKESE
jgi:hypothetical protein